ncbi:MAG: BspA family leucine-rich repeat surface protein, partial [Reichenbachiella sp.]
MNFPTGPSQLFRSVFIAVFFLSFSISGIAQNMSLDLSGGPNNVEIDYNVNTSEFTVEGWVYFNDLSDGSHAIFAKTGEPPLNDHIAAPFDLYVTTTGDTRTGTVSAWFGGGTNSTSANSTTSLIENQWYHVAIVYDPTDVNLEGKIFIDGALETEFIVSGGNVPLNSTQNVRLGNRGDDGTEASALYDDFRIWNVARSTVEIAGNKDIELVGNEPGLEVYLPMNGNLDDIAGFDHNGIDNGLDGFSLNNVFDTTSPSLAIDNVDEPFSTQFQFQVIVDEEATLHIVAITTGNAPNASQIIAGTDGLGNPAAEVISYGVNGNNNVAVFNLLASTVYDIYTVAEDYSGNRSGVETFTVTMADPDLVSPVLSIDQVYPALSTQFDFDITVDEPSELYLVLLTTDTGEPTPTQIKNGQDLNSNPAAYSFGYSVNGSNGASAYGLNPSTTYYIYTYAEDYSGNASNVETFIVTTDIPDVVSPTLSIDQVYPALSTHVDFDITVDEEATLHIVALLDNTFPPLSTDILAGTDGNGGGAAQQVSYGVNGFNTVSAFGLSPSTTYYIYAFAEDASSNPSNIETFTVTTSVPDVTPPMMSIDAVNTPDHESFDFTITVDEDYNLHWVALTTDITPDANQVLLGQDGNGDPAFLNAQYGGPTGTEVFGIGGLSATTMYYFYLVAEDFSGNLSSVENFTVTTGVYVPPFDVTFSTPLPLVSGGNLVAGSTNNLVYKVLMAAPDGVATMQGFVFTPNGDFDQSDFVQFNYYVSVGVDDFSDALINGYLGSFGYFEEGNPYDLAPGTIGLLFGDIYTNEAAVYWYVTVDVAASATNGKTFGIDQPLVDQNFGITEDHNSIDGGLLASNIFTIDNPCVSGDFIGAVDGDVTDPANWCEGTVPDNSNLTVAVTYTADASISETQDIIVSGGGSISVDPGNIVDFDLGSFDLDLTSGPFTNNGVVTFFNTANILNASNFFNNGTLQGMLNFVGNFTNNGVFSPGFSPACANIAGDYINTGTDLIEIEGMNETCDAGDGFDQIFATGNVDISAATLQVSIGSYSPVNGDKFIFLEAGGTLIGKYADITGVPANWHVEYDYPNASVQLRYDDGTEENALDFAGTEHVNLGSSINAVFDGNSNLTLEAWVYPTTTNADQTIIGNYDAASDMQYLLRIGGDKAFFYVGTGVSAFSGLNGTISIPTNAWTHIAATYDGADMRLYINGVEDGTGVPLVATFPAQASLPVTIGGLDGSQYFTGIIDEVMVWDAARTAGEILSDAENGIASPGSELNLISYYKFNHGLDGADNLDVLSLFDEQGNNPGALSGFALNGSTSNFVGSDRPMPIPLATNAITLNGTTDYVDIGNGAIQSLGAVTFEAWVYYNNANSGYYEICSKEFVNSFGIQMGPDNVSNKLWFHIGNGSGWEGSGVASIGSIPEAQWTHVAASWDGGNVRMFINGVAESTTGHAGTMGSNATARGIGSYGQSAINPFNGSIDELRVWNRVLSSEQIAEFYNQEINEDANYPGLLAYYNFNDGATATDVSNGTQDGTLMGAPTFATPGPNLIAPRPLDGVSPTPSFSANSGDPANGDPMFTINIDFGEDVTSFDLSDINVTNGTVANLSGGLDSYTVDIYPALSGSVDISMNASVVEDLTGNANSASGVYSVTYNAPNNALNFDGTDDVVDLTDTFHPTVANNLTIEAWVYPDAVGVFQVITSRYINGTIRAGDYYLAINAANQLEFFLRTNLNDRVVTSTGTIPISTWTHVAAVWDGTSGHILYINGVQDGILAFSGETGNAGGNRLALIGDHTTAGTAPFSGSIDELAFWNDARTIVEVPLDAEFGIANPTGQANLVAYYKFNQGIADGSNPSVINLYDEKQVVNGTLSGFALSGGASSNFTDSPVPMDLGNSFITTWVTSDGQFTIPTSGGGTYNAVWTNLTNPGVGEGSIVSHTGDYSVTGLTNGDTYQLAITGDLRHFYLNNDFTNRSKLVGLIQWGNIAWTSMNAAFQGATNMVVTATDAPDFTTNSVTDLSYMFANAINADFSAADFSGWSTITVTDMSWMFNSAGLFNVDISAWDVDNVVTMQSTFETALAFDQDISGWIVDNVTNMNSMFAETDFFNQPIGIWNVTGVTNMFYMFAGSNFNQDISAWTLGPVIDISYMFNNNPAFNQDISGWDISGATNLSSTFEWATAFDQDLGAWDVTSVTTMQWMFDKSGMSMANYDATLNGWAAQGPLQPAVPLGADGLLYSATGQIDRDILTQTPNFWVITGDGLYSPTTLLEGDIAFTMMNTSDTNDEFAFVALANMDAGTEIWFTDKGWDNGLFRPSTTSEGYLHFVASTTIEARDQILINPGTLIAYNVTDATTAGTLTEPFGTFSIPATGDQILAFQGTVTGTGVTQVTVNNFLSAINTNQLNQDIGGTEWSIDADGSVNQSELPNTLVNGINAVSLFPGGDTFFQDALFDDGASLHAGSIASIRAVINEDPKTNWDFVDGSPWMQLSLSPFGTNDNTPTSGSFAGYTGTGTVKDFSENFFPFTDADGADVLQSLRITDVSALSGVATLFYDGNLDGINGAEDIFPPYTITRDDLIQRKLKIEMTGSVGASGSFSFDQVSDGDNADATIYTFTGNLIDNALDFDGADDYVYVNDDASLETANYTLEAWINISAFPASNDIGMIVQKGSFDGDVNGYIFGINNNSGTIQLAAAQIAGDGSTQEIAFYDYAFNTSTWYHVASTFDGTNIRLYINGNEVYTFPVSVGGIDYIGATNEGLKIGALEDGTSGGVYTNFFSGLMDNVRIWDRALSQAELQLNAFSTITSDANLVAAYDFNDGEPSGADNSQENFLKDITDNGFDGQLTGFGLTGATSNWVTSTFAAGTYSEITVNIDGFNTDLTSGSVDPVGADIGTYFGRVEVGVQKDIQLEISNDGLQDLNVASIVAGGEFTTPGFSGIIAPGATELITLSYTPAANGADTQTITINSDDADESVFTFDVGGFAGEDASLHFDGTDDQVDLAGGESMLDALTVQDTWTLDVWVKIDDNTGFNGIIGGTTGGGNANAIWLNNGIIEIRNSANGLDLRSTASAVPTDIWTHIAVVSENGVGGRIYVNGADVTDGGSNNATILGAGLSGILKIGQTPDNTGPMSGSIDKLRFWNTAFDSFGISQLMSTDVSGNEQDLLAAYIFDEGIAGADNTGIGAPEIVDLAGTYSGTMSGFAKTGSSSNWVLGSLYPCNLGEFIGTSGDDATDAANWCGGIVPDGTADIAIYGNSTFTGSGYTLDNSDFSIASGIDVNMNFTGILNLINGATITNNGKLFLGSSTTLQAGSGTFNNTGFLGGKVVCEVGTSFNNTVSGTLSPGLSPETTSFPSGFTNSGTLDLEVFNDPFSAAVAGTDFDFVDVTGGNVTLDNASIINVIADASFVPTGNFTIRLMDLTNGGTWADNGVVINLPGGNWSVNQVTGVDGYLEVSYSTGGSLTLDGSTQYVNSDASIGISGDADRTIEFWYKQDVAATSIEHLINWGAATTNNAFGLMVSASNELSLYDENGNDATGYSIPDLLWHHYAVTHDGTLQEVRVFVDGVETPSSNFNKTLNTTDGTLLIGIQAGPANYAGGEFDDVRVWNVARTPQQIRQYANTALLTPESEGDLVLNYLFDEGAGTAVDNAASAAVTLDGTLANAPTWNGTSDAYNNTTSILEVSATISENVVDDGNTAGTPADTDFGLVGLGGNQTTNFTITNIGLKGLNIASIALTPDAKWSITNETIGTLTPGASSTFDLTYAPDVSMVDPNAVVITTSGADVPADQTYTVNVTGTGDNGPNLASATTISESQIDFVFDEPVNFVVDEATFLAGIAATGLNTGGAASTTGEGTTTISVTLDPANYVAVNYTASDLGIAASLVEGAALIGNIVVAGANIADGIVPSMSSVDIYDTDDDGFVDRIDLVFDENIDTDDGVAPVIGDLGTLTLPDGSSVTNDSGGGSMAISDPLGGTNVVSITNIPVADHLSTIANTAIGSTDIAIATNTVWVDAAGNALPIITASSVTITDNAVPSLVSGTTISATEIALVFSEVVNYVTDETTSLGQ